MLVSQGEKIKREKQKRLRTIEYTILLQVFVFLYSLVRESHRLFCRLFPNTRQCSLQNPRHLHEPREKERANVVKVSITACGVRVSVQTPKTSDPTSLSTLVPP